MKLFFSELLQYDRHFNHEIVSALLANQTKVSERCIRLTSHILNVHQIWNLKIQPGQLAYESWKVHPIQDLENINQENFERSTNILETFDLDQAVEYATSSGKIFKNSVRDILFQIINHSTYHRGQIATEFR